MRTVCERERDKECVHACVGFLKLFVSASAHVQFVSFTYT